VRTTACRCPGQRPHAFAKPNQPVGVPAAVAPAISNQRRIVSWRYRTSTPACRRYVTHVQSRQRPSNSSQSHRMTKRQPTRKSKSLSHARASRRPVRRPPTRVEIWSAKALRWLTTSNLVLVVGILVAAMILTIMYYRLTQPTSTGETQATPTFVITPSSRKDGPAPLGQHDPIHATLAHRPSVLQSARGRASP